MFYRFINKNLELFDRVFPNRINSPDGLSNIYQSQQEQIKAGNLPK